MSPPTGLTCLRCNASYPAEDIVTGCSRCRSQGRPANLANAIWLGEGETPLIHATGLGAQISLNSLYLKNETRNPTGSYKDRMAAVAIGRAREIGASVVTIASSGNGGAALAAYAA